MGSNTLGMEQFHWACEGSNTSACRLGGFLKGRVQALVAFSRGGDRIVTRLLMDLSADLDGHRTRVVQGSQQPEILHVVRRSLAGEQEFEFAGHAAAVFHMNEDRF